METLPIYVRGLGAVSGLAASWNANWRELLDGKVSLTNFDDCGFSTRIPVAVSAVPGLARELEEQNGVTGAALRLAHAALTECLASGDFAGRPLALYGGTNHGETDIVLNLAASTAASTQGPV